MSTQGQQRLVLFDFDGTLTRYDSLFIFLRFFKGRLYFIKNFFHSLPTLISLKLGYVDNSTAKEKLLSIFLKGKKVNEFATRSKMFSLNQIPLILNKSIVEKFHEHIASGDKVVIISASVEDWILPWAQQWNVDVLATKLAFERGMLTGKFQGKNCNYEEKSVRIKIHLQLSDYDEIWAYGDSLGDEAMFELATKVVYRGKERV